MFTGTNTAADGDTSGVHASKGVQSLDKMSSVTRGQVGKTRVNNDDANSVRMQWVSHMERIRDAQDRKAFAELFGHFAPRVKGFLMKSGADAALAEECAQEVMATVWLKARMFDPARASVATWIFTVARNRRIDILRKENRPEPEELPWGPDRGMLKTLRATCRSTIRRRSSEL